MIDVITMKYLVRKLRLRAAAESSRQRRKDLLQQAQKWENGQYMKIKYESAIGNDECVADITGERDQLRISNARLLKENAELRQLLELAYAVYRDANGMVGSNYIFSLADWLSWLPSQTDEALNA